MIAPRVTCVLPTANRHVYVPLAVRCFLEQDFRDAELLVLDDGAEPVLPLLPAAEMKLGRIRYFGLTGKRVLGDKRNLGADLARGSVIVHWDDDDWSAPPRLGDQVERLDDSGKAVTGYSSMLFFDERTRRTFLYEHKPEYALGTSLCYRRAWALLHPFPSKQISEDGDFVRAAVAAGEAAIVPGRQLMVARIHAGNTAEKNTEARQYRSVAPTEVPPAFWRARVA